MDLRGGSTPLRVAVCATLVLLFTSPVLAAYSIDEDPTENPLDPGDVFLPGAPPVCEVDDGDGSCPVLPSFLVPQPEQFDVDAYTIDAPLLVCPADPPYPPGILFSFDDGDPGPGSGPPDHSTEIFFYDHCAVLSPARGSWYTSITETFLGLPRDPPPIEFDDDVDAYETRDALPFWDGGTNLLFSPDRPSDGGLGAGSEGNIYSINVFSAGPSLWATAAALGVPDPEFCDIDGIARILDPDMDRWMVLFTTDLQAPCGLDPGDIYASDLAGSYALYADDVVDMKIAFSELDDVDIDALAINTDGQIQIIDPYEPRDPGTYKADWPDYAPSGMPDFSQDHRPWPPTWCGPSAAADSLWWFDSEMECDLDHTTGDPAETEPNDACDLANRLGENPWLVASLSPAADVEDWYVFDVPYAPRHSTCTVAISTCAKRAPADADTFLDLFDDCSTTGVPGPLIAANDDACPPATQSEIEIDLEGGRYWVRVSRGASGVGTDYTLSLGIDCYPMVGRGPDVSDDHSEDNPKTLIEDLSVCMNTDDVLGTGSGHKGTLVPDMETCFLNWLAARDLDPFYTVNVYLMPPYDHVAREIERSEDVILLLGFWWTVDGAVWTRCGGHYVTAAGVDRLNDTLTVSDPALNNAEPPPAGHGAPGRVRGPDHLDHAPAINPPPDHDDTENLSHDRYPATAPQAVPLVSDFSLGTYATPGTATTCADVQRWCVGDDWGQNPQEPPGPQEPCPNAGFTVSAEVEAMVDVSPVQSPVCVYLDPVLFWPENLRLAKGACSGPSPMAVDYDVLRGKLCDLRFRTLVPEVNLGPVRCLYNGVAVDQFDDESPNHTDCLGGWFYLIRESTDPHYGTAWPGGESRLPEAGGCP